MSRVRTTIWATVFSSTVLATTGLYADTTQSEIRRLQQELDQLKANLTQDAPTHTPSNPVQWPGFAVFGKVSVDAIYDDKNAGLNDLLIPSTIPAGDTHQQNFELHGKNSQLGLRVGEGSGPNAVFAVDLFGSIDGYDLRVRDFYFEYGALRAGYGYTALLDGAAWPLTLDSQGPNSAIFARQTGVRWQGEHLTLAVEDPNPEVYDPDNLTSASGRRPDVIAAWNQPHGRGHVRTALVNREIGVKFANGDQQYASATGCVVSGTLAMTDSLTLLASASYGEAMGHYYNDLSGFADAGMDGYVFATDGLKPLLAQGGYLAGQWQFRPDWTLAIVGGEITLEKDAELPGNAMRRTRYGTLSLIRQHDSSLSYGAELAYGLRDNQAGDRSEAPRVQLNLTYRFEHTHSRDH
jgi:hypothetical protein